MTALHRIPVGRQWPGSGRFDRRPPRRPGRWGTQGELESELPGSVADAARRYLGSIAGAGQAVTAIVAGERDEGRLTDLLFNARHPERHGRRIQPGERALVQEWTSIRSSIARPALAFIAMPHPAALAPPAAPSPFILPPDLAQLRPPARAHVGAAPLIGGDRAFTACEQLITGVAARPDGWLYLANWYCDHNLQLPSGRTLAQLLLQCTMAGAKLRALFWGGSFEQLDPEIRKLLAVASLPLAAVGGSALTVALEPYIRRHVVARYNHSNAANHDTANYINTLHRAFGRDAVAATDDATLPVGSHHQKILVAGNSERTVAVIGGVEWNKDRLSPPPGSPPAKDGTPYFDLSVQLDGQAAEDVAALFDLRWRADPTRGRIELPKRRQPPAAPSSGGATVQIGPNFGCGAPFASNPHPIRGGSRLIENLFRHCRTFFYAEDQYGIGNPDLEDAIRQAFADGARFGVIVLANSAAVDDIPELAYHRHQFWTKFPQTRSGNLLVFERIGDDGTTEGPHAYVHSKLVLVDDEAASIGSLNLNRRSWYTDSEITAVLADAPDLIRGLRIELWQQHLRPGPSEDIANPLSAWALWQAVSTGARRGALVTPVSFAKVPGRYSRFDTVNDILDRAYDAIFDPPDPCR